MREVISLKNIYILTDYKGNFGSKWDSIPYRSGLQKNDLIKHFLEYGYQVNFQTFYEAANRIDSLKNNLVLYTSSEDIGYHYKDFIEDVIYYFEQQGESIIPPYKFLRANNNKVYMELLRKEIGKKWGDSLNSHVFSTYDELKENINNIMFPIVLKEPKGALSRGVHLARNKSELLKKAKILSRTRHLRQDIKDFLRPYKQKNYRRESLYRNKFVLQEFIPNLKNDWKIIIFGSRYYVLKRSIKEGDFRASGSHYNYGFGSKADLPNGILEFAESIFVSLDVPHASLDIVFDGSKFYLIEFQCIFFGTSIKVKSDIYYSRLNDKWKEFKNLETLEKVYVDSIHWFLAQK